MILKITDVGQEGSKYRVQILNDNESPDEYLTEDQILALAQCLGDWLDSGHHDNVVFDLDEEVDEDE